MAYETGTASSPSDLINKLAVFAQANGWTVTGETTSAATGTTPISKAGRVFSKGSLVYGIGYDADDIWIAAATGVNGAAWNVQTGSTVVGTSGYLAHSNDIAGPYTAYHFFAGTNPDYLHVVVERSPGIFKHLMMGSLKKFGTFIGGAYCGAVYWNMASYGGNPVYYYMNVPDSGTHQVPFDVSSYWNALSSQYQRNSVRADIDGKSNNWMYFHYSYQGNSARGVMRNPNSLYESLFERIPSEFNQLTPFLPIMAFADRPSNLLSPLGQVPDMRYVNMTNFASGEVVTIAGVEWLVFPLIQKTESWGSGVSTIPSSGNYGLAYRRN